MTVIADTLDNKLDASGWIPARLDDFDKSDETTYRYILNLIRRIKLKPVRILLGADADGCFSVPVATVAANARNRSPKRYPRQSLPFLMQATDNPSVATEIGRVLESNGNDPLWSPNRWVMDSIETGCSIIAVYIRGTRDLGGMASFFRMVFVSGNEDGSIEVYYNFHAEHVYVVPQARGMGLSSALRFATSKVACEDLAALHGILSRTRKATHGKKLWVTVFGEGHTTEGLRFLDNVTDDMELSIKKKLPHTSTCFAADGKVLREYGV